ncbi:uncharacterized protein LOC118435747 [Folsomia candida]|uniref:uncharacterized protein LOC118435747 n=1 Tax=Folsomia candida TaxID=158441 RepID=UPI001604AC05|nr:uncharacterized protein LOC118435747 [Folsomia candida]
MGGSGSYCCNLCGDMAPTKLAILAHLAQWHKGKRERTQEKKWRKSEGKSKGKRSDAKADKEAKADKDARADKDAKANKDAPTTTGKIRENKSKDSGFRKTGTSTDKPVDDNAVANDETPKLKFSTYGRTSYGTRARSRMGDGESSSVNKSSEVIDESTSVAKKHKLPPNEVHEGVGKTRKLTDEENILVKKVVDKITNVFLTNGKSFTKKHNVNVLPTQVLAKKKPPLEGKGFESRILNQADKPIKISNKPVVFNRDTKIDPVTHATPEISSTLPTKKNEMLKPIKTAPQQNRQKLEDEIPVFDITDDDEVEDINADKQMNNEEHDNRPDSPVYLFPRVKSTKSLSLTQEEQVKKMPQLAPATPPILTKEPHQPGAGNTGENVRKQRPKARISPNTLQCPLCPTKCNTGFILHRHLAQNHAGEIQCKRKELNKTTKIGHPSKTRAPVKLPTVVDQVGSIGQKRGHDLTPTSPPRESPAQLPATSPGNNLEKPVDSTTIEAELEELLSSPVKTHGNLDNIKKVEVDTPKKTNGVELTPTNVHSLTPPSPPSTVKVPTPQPSPTDSVKTISISILSSPSFKCDECGTPFHTANGLSVHASLNHAVENVPVPPKELESSAISLTDDAESMSIMNSSTSTATPGRAKLKISIPLSLYHSCSACIEEFAFSHELTKHEADHGLGFACLGCGGSFKFKTNLDKHFQKAHPELSMGKCTWVLGDHCAIWKSSSAEMNEHVRQVHPQKVNAFEDRKEDLVCVKQELNSEESYWPVVDLE